MDSGAQYQPGILVCDDDPSQRQYIATVVKNARLQATVCETGEEALRLLRTRPFEILLLDVQLPGLSGLAVLKEVRERHPDVGVIMISVLKDLGVVVEAMRMGALDYVTKDFSPAELQARLQKTLEQLRNQKELVFLRGELSRYARTLVRGRSARMVELLGILDRVANSTKPVLFSGESGTGKEMLARYLHDRSDRRAAPFVSVNVSGLDPAIAEVALFGSEKGTFSQRFVYGRAELASGGTLFIDEVADLKLDLQARLLRALQDHEIERFGQERPVRVDLRVVCATSRDLEKETAEGRFREDLFEVLQAVPIRTPPLRERPEDIPDLAGAFLERACMVNGRPPKSFSENAVQLLRAYDWPGNVRELETTVERCAVLCQTPVVEDVDLPLDVVVAAALGRETTLAAAVAAFESGYLRRVLHQSRWNRRRAAEQLGMGYSTLKGRLKAYAIGPADDEDGS